MTIHDPNRPLTTSRADSDVQSNPFVLARVRLGLTPKELAQRLNTSLYALSRWERGDIAPTEDIIDRLSLLLKGLDPPYNDEQYDYRPEIHFASHGVETSRSMDPTDQLFTDDGARTLESPRDSVLTAILCDDQFWGGDHTNLGTILERNTQPAVTRTSPLQQDISAGKNTYTYDAHTYHTKVPPQGIATVLREYLPRGGIVLDPFAGSGMTGVAARYLGLDVVLNDLSPAACFISLNFNTSIDDDRFQHTIEAIIADLIDLRRDLYSTDCRECGKLVPLVFTVWSYRLECNICRQDFTLWDHCRQYGRTVREHKILREFPCPHCSTVVNKSYLERKDAVPVVVAYRCCSKRIVEHPLNDSDTERIDRLESTLDQYPYQIPTNQIPGGVNLDQPIRHGLDSIDKLYTARNLIACAAIWHQVRRIQDPTLATAAAFTFTSMYRRVTRLAEYRFWGGSGNTANLNVPHIFYEANVFVTFERKAKSIVHHLRSTAREYSGSKVIRTGSASDLSYLPDESIDLVFTDPPFGGNINYSEMNLLWESWLGIFTNPDAEAIVNRYQGKDVESYRRLLTECLREVYRVLRPGHWMVLVFMNSSGKIWKALHQAVTGVGFEIKETSMFDKQHGTFKQFVSANTVGANLMVHCQKPLNDSSQQKDQLSLTPTDYLGVRDFLTSRIEELPMLSYLHVDRAAQVDYGTLYARYVSEGIQQGRLLLGFEEFRKKATTCLQLSL